MKGSLDTDKKFRVPTTGGKDRYWAYPQVVDLGGGVVLHEAVDAPGLFSVSHEETGFSLLLAVNRSIAEYFFREILGWPEWTAIHSKGDAQFLRKRIRQAREVALNA